MKCILTLLFFPFWLYGQNFSELINVLPITPGAKREALIDSFFAKNSHTPFIANDTTVYFVYRGRTSRVTVAGDANDWNSGSWPMVQSAGTSLWYYRAHFENDARLDYKFVVGGNAWLLDPRNPNTCTGGYGPNSELRMPHYEPPPEIEYDAAIPHGALFDTTLSSAALGYGRRIRVYLPPGYAATTRSYPLLLVHDGLDYLNLARMNNVLDHVIAQKKTEPLIAVFVPAVRREEEYAGALQEKFSSFIIDEVLPFIDRRFRTATDPAFRATMGASNGGNISLWLGFTYPQQFGHVIAQSSYIQSSLLSGFQNEPNRPLTLYLDLGAYDIPLLLTLVRTFVPMVLNKSYVCKYQEFHEGHSWGNWRAHIDDALTFTFPSSTTGLHPQKTTGLTDFCLCAYPNPFNDSTRLSFELPEEQEVTLLLYNIMGQPVALLYSGRLAQGRHTIAFSAKGLASGILYCRLATAQGSAVISKVLCLK